MNGNVLGDLIQSKLDAVIAGLSDPNNIDETDRSNMMRAMGNAIVEHIQTAGIVNFPIPVQVTPATGTGATTAAGSIS
jgi:hypothetical protein